MLTIAWLTWKEAFRRRAPVISLLIVALLLVGAFVPMGGRLRELPFPIASRIYSSLYVFFSIDILKFFASIFGIALASGAISGELERGVLSSILPKPITRLSVYAGKWLGLFLFVAANVLLWATVIWLVATYRAPDTSHAAVWHALPYLMLYPAMFVTLALMFSTFASFPLAGGLAILFTGVGWSEAVLYILKLEFDIALLGKLSKAAGFIMPLGRMSRWVEEGMGPLASFGGRQVGGRSPFRDIEAVPFDLVYIGMYLMAAFAVGAWVLGRRDI